MEEFDIDTFGKKKYFIFKELISYKFIYYKINLF